MKRFHSIHVILLITLFVIGCVQPPNYPREPVIEFLNLNKDAIAQGNGAAQPDTLVINFSFTDGDGDLGFEEDSIDIFLTDSRDGFVNTFRLPLIPDQGTGNGISGEIALKISNTPFNICCTFPNGATACQPNSEFPTDTVSYSIQIRDRAGNYSNPIQTDLVTILCN